LSKKEQKKLEDEEFERVLKEMGVAEQKPEDHSAVKTATHEVDEKKQAANRKKKEKEAAKKAAAAKKPEEETKAQ
jgi:hypothetical protein